jgi:solute carrier family 25 (mitochondrial uncoupling protein), member 8/9
VRLQIQNKTNPTYRGLFHVMTSMVRDEGLTTPWRGVSAGIQRQMAFAPIRIGLYEPVRNFYVGKDQTGPPTVMQKIAAGLTTSSAPQDALSSSAATQARH